MSTDGCKWHAAAGYLEMEDCANAKQRWADYDQGVQDERRRVQLILMNEDARNGHWVRYVSELLIEAKPATNANAVMERP